MRLLYKISIALFIIFYIYLLALNYYMHEETIECTVTKQYLADYCEGYYQDILFIYCIDDNNQIHEYYFLDEHELRDDIVVGDRVKVTYLYNTHHSVGKVDRIEPL